LWYNLMLFVLVVTERRKKFRCCHLFNNSISTADIEVSYHCIVLLSILIKLRMFIIPYIDIPIYIFPGHECNDHLGHVLIK
jgi:hypothetical protein